MTANGRRYLENIIETQAEKIREQEILTITLKASVTSLQSKILNHRCTLKEIVRQIFGYEKKFESWK